MFDEESKERLISILEDEGFDFDYEKEPYQKFDTMWWEDAVFYIQIQKIKFELTAHFMTPTENAYANNGVLWSIISDSLCFNNLNDDEIFRLLKGLNELNNILTSVGVFCCLKEEEEDSRRVVIISRDDLIRGSFSEDDTIRFSIKAYAIKRCLELVSEKFSD